MSTDSDSIADTARKYGVWVPFLRNPKLAVDDSSIVDVVRDAMEYAENHGKEYEYVALLQPTSPLRNAGHINSVAEVFIQKSLNRGDTLVSVKSMEEKVRWIMG